MAWLRLGLLLTLAAPGLARADEPPAAAVAIAPPGEGMIEQPCPVLPVPRKVRLAEPGQPAELGQSYIAAVVASQGYKLRYDWAFQCRYAAENAALTQAPDVVFMGDSITENWREYDPGFFDHGIADRGISGQTTPQMLVRFMADVIALKPRAVQIMAGTNDIAGNTGPTSPEQYRNAIRAMVELAQAHGIRVILASIPPGVALRGGKRPAPGPMIDTLNAWLKTYAAERHAIYADYHAVLLGEDGAMQPGFTSDGVHPATAGYAVMRPVAEAAIKAALRR